MLSLFVNEYIINIEIMEILLLKKIFVFILHTYVIASILTKVHRILCDAAFTCYMAHSSGQNQDFFFF